MTDDTRPHEGEETREIPVDEETLLDDTGAGGGGGTGTGGRP
jgi:hypothetical protein